MGPLLHIIEMGNLGMSPQEQQLANIYIVSPESLMCKFRAPELTNRQVSGFFFPHISKIQKKQRPCKDFSKAHAAC